MKNSILALLGGVAEKRYYSLVQENASLIIQRTTIRKNFSRISEMSEIVNKLILANFREQKLNVTELSYMVEGQQKFISILKPLLLKENHIISKEDSLFLKDFEDAVKNRFFLLTFGKTHIELLENLKKEL